MGGMHTNPEMNYVSFMDHDTSCGYFVLDLIALVHFFTYVFQEPNAHQIIHARRLDSSADQAALSIQAKSALPREVRMNKNSQSRFRSFIRFVSEHERNFAFISHFFR